MTMHQTNGLEIDQDDLRQRRELAKARYSREAERNALLDTLINTANQAERLRGWIATQAKSRQPAEMSRMLDWARAELAALEAVAAPARLAALLRQRDLFPEVDRLVDPLGEPPSQRPWGR